MNTDSEGRVPRVPEFSGINREPRQTRERKFKYAEGVTEINPALADAIGLHRENIPQNKFPLRSRSGRGEGQGEVRANSTFNILPSSFQIWRGPG